MGHEFRRIRVISIRRGRRGMERDTTVEQPEAGVSYESPRIEDYGTLAELTAGITGAKTDILGNQVPGGGGGGGGGFS